jgi:hypothetical protein
MLASLLKLPIFLGEWSSVIIIVGYLFPEMRFQTP